MINNDYKNGLVKDFTDEAIAKYSVLLPLKFKATVALAADVMKKIKASDFSFQKYLDAAKMSAAAKQTLSDLMLHVQKDVSVDLQKYLINKVTIVRSLKLPDAENEFLLSMFAVLYNRPLVAADIPPSGNGSPCYINGIQQENCVSVGIVLGGSIGFMLCGPLCGLGGAIVGGLVGSLS